LQWCYVSAARLNKKVKTNKKVGRIARVLKPFKTLAVLPEQDPKRVRRKLSIGRFRKDVTDERPAANKPGKAGSLQVV